MTGGTMSHAHRDKNTAEKRDRDFQEWESSFFFFSFSRKHLQSRCTFF